MPKKKRKIITAVVIAEKPSLLSGQAQQLYNDLQDLKEEAGKVRLKRSNALMQNGKYASLKTTAEKIVKEASVITKEFDHDHPEYKRAVGEVAEDAKQVSIGLARIAIAAIRAGVTLEVYQGVGKSRKRVNLTLSVQPTLF